MATKTLPQPAGLSAELPADGYINLNAAPKYIPGKPHRATAWRHALDGVLVGDRRVILQTIKVGGKRLTRLEWIREFIAAMNPDAPVVKAAAAGRRKLQTAAAMAELQAMGVGG